jgi:DNA end-binding protein Ku
MAPRAYWKGFLKLSLVACPVVLFPATTGAERTHFHRINKKNGHRLHQQMVDEQTGKVVDKDEIGRGYELSKGRSVEIEEDELAAVQLESTHTIDIDSFVPRDDVDRRYLDKPYYIAPDGKMATEAYAVIRDAMRDKDRVALGRVVLANREHVMAIEPLGKGLLGTTLRYPYEMRGEADYFDEIKSPKIPKDMIGLAEHILDTKESRFDPSRFKDRYEDALKALVKRKASGKTIEAPEPAADRDNVIDLMEALRRSVQGAKKSGGSKKTAKKNKTTAKRGRRRAA